MLANVTRPGWWRDGVLAAVLTLLAFVPTLSTVAAQLGDLPVRPPDGLAVALALAQTVPLAIVSRWPAACLAIVGTAFMAHQALGYPQTFGSMGLYLAMYAVGAHQVRFRLGLAAVATGAYVVLAVLLHNLGSPNRPQDFVVSISSWG